MNDHEVYLVKNNSKLSYRCLSSLLFKAINSRPTNKIARSLSSTSIIVIKDGGG
jgi:hypothetical protein